MCSCIGEVLAQAGYRVTSGGAPYVGIDAVNSAFAQNELLGRFYLRSGGHPGVYQRTAPVVIVRGTGYQEVRKRYIGELNVLVAVGGRSGSSGVVDEIRTAIERRVPVLLLPQAGGAVAEFKQTFLADTGLAYGDAGLAAAVESVNRAVWAVAAADLEGYLRSKLVGHVKELISALLQADIDASAGQPSEYPAW